MWRRPETRQDLDEVLKDVMQARVHARAEAPSRVAVDLVTAINSIMKAYRSAHSVRLGDVAALHSLLTGLPAENQGWLVGRDSVAALANFSPAIESDLPNNEEPPAADHDHFRRAYEELHRQPSSRHREETVKALASLLSIVCSNIIHAGKAARSPNEERVERNGRVVAVALPVLNDTVDALLDHPSRRLACYGSLRPRELHHDELNGLSGTWTDGYVPGLMADWEGYSRLTWLSSGEMVAVSVFESEELERVWDQIDRFEGLAYVRSFVPVSVGERTVIASCYLSAGELDS